VMLADIATMLLYDLNPWKHCSLGSNNIPLEAHEVVFIYAELCVQKNYKCSNSSDSTDALKTRTTFS